MKVLYICPNGYLGGAERFICNLSQAHIQDKRIEHSVLFFSDGDAVEYCKKLGVKVYILKNKFRMRNILNFSKALFETREIIKNGKYEIIHSTMPYAHIVSFLSSLFLGLKKVWFQHGPVGGVLDHIANFLEVSKIYFNTSYLQSVHNQMPMAERNLYKQKIVNYGILDIEQNIDTVQEIRDNYKGKTILLNPGRICSWKGQDRVIKSLGLIDKNVRNDLKLLIVGTYARKEDEQYYLYLKNLVAELKLEDTVEFLGHKNNITDYYCSADIMIHSSVIPEPFGLVVAESMLLDSLVLGSDSGGVSDILIEGETGFTYPSLSENAHEYLATKIVRVLDLLSNKPEEISKIKVVAKKLISEEYSIKQLNENLVNDYQGILSKSV